MSLDVKNNNIPTRSVVNTISIKEYCAQQNKF